MTGITTAAGSVPLLLSSGAAASSGLGALMLSGQDGLTTRAALPPFGSEPSVGAQRLGLVGALPGELGLAAAEVAVGGGRAVDRAQ